MQWWLENKDQDKTTHKSKISSHLTLQKTVKGFHVRQTDSLIHWGLDQLLDRLLNEKKSVCKGSSGCLSLSRGGSSCRGHTKLNNRPNLSPGCPACLPTVPRQGPQSARTGNPPPPAFTTPEPRHTSRDGEKVAVGSCLLLLIEAPASLCSHGEVKRLFCSLASPCKNTTQPPPLFVLQNWFQRKHWVKFYLFSQTHGH